MAWPTNKPDSDKFSSDESSIKESRPELNTMSQAVNDIVDFVDTTGIDNDEFSLLVYNRNTGKLQVASVGTNISVDEDSAGRPFIIDSGAGTVTNPLSADLEVYAYNIVSPGSAFGARTTPFKITNNGLFGGYLRLEDNREIHLGTGVASPDNDLTLSFDVNEFSIKPTSAILSQRKPELKFSNFPDSAANPDNFGEINLSATDFNIDAQIRYREQVFELPFGVNLTPDVGQNGNLMEITLTNNTTFDGFANAENGQSLTLIIRQDAVGNRTLTENLDSAGRMLWAGGINTLSTGANAVDVLSIMYVGGIYYASLSTNFS